MSNLHQTDSHVYKVKLINQILSGYRIVVVLANSITITRRWLKHGYKTMSEVQSPELKLMIPVYDEY